MEQTDFIEKNRVGVIELNTESDPTGTFTLLGLDRS
jgi:hypothetical protein